MSVCLSGVLKDVGKGAGSNDVPNDAAASFKVRLFFMSDTIEEFLDDPGFFNGEDTSALFGYSIAFDMDRLSLVLGDSSVLTNAGMML